MAKIGIVADDLTGATTVGALLARAGISTAAFFDEKSLDVDKDYDAIILSSDSRSDEKLVAQRKVKSAVQALKEKGTAYFSKRIDTTLRGGIGCEIDAMLEELPADTIAVMVPAMPQSKRIVVGGYSIIDGVALSKTPVAFDVKTPVTESFIPNLMAKQSKQQVGLVTLNSILTGMETLKASLTAEKEKGSKLIIVDAITIEDVKTIAEAVTEIEWNVLAVDPGPFSEQLAIVRGFGKQDSQLEPNNFEEENMKGTVLVVAGSATPVTKTQMRVLAEKSWTSHVSVSAEELIDIENKAIYEITRATEEALKLVKEKKSSVIMLETALTGKVLDLAAKEKEFNLHPGEASNNINIGLGQIVQNVLNKEPVDIRGIYMTGGDTMVNILKVLGAKGIELLDYVIPQADLGKIIGGRYDGLVVVGKGGLTGTENTAVSIVKRIFKESEKTYHKTKMINQ